MLALINEWNKSMSRDDKKLVLHSASDSIESIDPMFILLSF